jgi:hypothetical protein
MSKGLSRAQAAGIVGNLIVEASEYHGQYLNPAVPGGVGQWGGSRLTGMLAYEHDKPSFQKQLEYVWQELSRHPQPFPQGYGLATLRRAKTPQQAAVDFMLAYERPQTSLEHESRRILNAMRVYRRDYGSPA